MTQLPFRLATELAAAIRGKLICPAATRDLARKSGYAAAEILPLGHPVWRFCQPAS
jgi:hypothetical protein